MADNTVLSIIFKFIESLAKFINGLNKEERKKIRDAVVKAYEFVFRAYYRMTKSF